MDDLSTITICEPDGTTLWKTLFTISVTINGIVAIYILLRGVMRFIWHWKNHKLPDRVGKKLPASPVGDFVNKHRVYLASLMSDTLLTATLFSGAFYILVSGAVEKPFVSQIENCHLVTLANILSSMTIGRLCVAVVMGIRRMRVIESPQIVTQCTKQAMEQMLSIIALALLLLSGEAMLTKTLLLIMCVDQNVYSLGFLVTKYSEQSRDLLIKLKVSQCFLSIAFRGAVPLVSLVVALTFYDNDILAMTTKSVAVFIGCGVVYLFYNSWVIITATRDVWCACSSVTRDTEKTASGTFFVNNKSSMFKEKVPLDNGFINNTRGLHIVTRIDPKTDFDAFVGQNNHGNFFEKSRNGRKVKLPCSTCAGQPKPTKVNNENGQVKTTIVQPQHLKPCSNVNLYTKSNIVKSMNDRKPQNVVDDGAALSVIYEESESLESVPL